MLGLPAERPPIHHPLGAQPGQRLALTHQQGPRSSVRRLHPYVGGSLDER